MYKLVCKTRITFNCAGSFHFDVLVNHTPSRRNFSVVFLSFINHKSLFIWIGSDEFFLSGFAPLYENQKFCCGVRKNFTVWSNCKNCITKKKQTRTWKIFSAWVYSASGLYSRSPSARMWLEEKQCVPKRCGKRTEKLWWVEKFRWNLEIYVESEMICVQNWAVFALVHVQHKP